MCFWYKPAGGGYRPHSDDRSCQELKEPCCAAIACECTYDILGAASSYFSVELLRLPHPAGGLKVELAKQEPRSQRSPGAASQPNPGESRLVYNSDMSNIRSRVASASFSAPAPGRRRNNKPTVSIAGLDVVHDTASHAARYIPPDAPLPFKWLSGSFLFGYSKYKPGGKKEIELNIFGREI